MHTLFLGHVTSCVIKKNFNNNMKVFFLMCMPFMYFLFSFLCLWCIIMYFNFSSSLQLMQNRLIVWLVCDSGISRPHRFYAIIVFILLHNLSQSSNMGKTLLAKSSPTVAFTQCIHTIIHFLSFVRSIHQFVIFAGVSLTICRPTSTSRQFLSSAPTHNIWWTSS